MKKNKLLFTVLALFLVIFLAFTLTDGRKNLASKNTTFSDKTVTVYGPPLDGPLSSLSESFEGTTFPPAGWIKLDPDGGTGWTSITAGTTPLPGWNGGVATVPTGGGSQTAYCSWNTGGASANDQWVVTPQLTNVQPGDSLTFWLRKPGYTNAYLDHFDVKISITTPIVSNFTINVLQLTSPANTPDTNWIQYKFRLGDFVSSGASIYIGFREWVLDNLNDGAAFQLDLVNVIAGSTPPTLTDPTTVCNYSSSTSFNGFYGHAATTLGDTLYVAGGSGAGASSTTVYRYAINSGNLSTGVPLPTVKASGVLVSAGNAMYYIGGSTGGVAGTAEGLSYKYTPAAGWTTITPTPNPKCGSVGMNWGDSVIFVVSGGWTTYSPTVEYYRIATNTWGSSTPIPAGRRSFAGGLTNGKIYVSCGYNGTFLNDLRIGTIGADASTITWAVGPVVPFSPAITGTSRPGGTAVNGKFYMVTGEVAGGATTGGCDSIFVFNATSNTWTGVISGRSPNQASNYWAAICNKVLANGKIKVFIPGGVSGVILPGLLAIQPDPCTITGVVNNSEVPKAYSLSQNYPNPFNPVTKISYEIPKSGLVTLKVYDILGKEIATLVNEVKNPGSFVVDFNGTSLSSGMYFYRLESGGFVSTKKMMLIK